MSVPLVGMMLVTSLAPNKEVATSLADRRGVTHTIWFAFLMAITVFLPVYLFLSLVATGFDDIAGFVPSILQPTLTASLLSAGGFLGVFSHLLGDMIVSSPGKPSMRPFWPIHRGPISFGIFDHQSPIVNEALLKIMVPITLLIYLLKVGIPSVYL